MILIGIVIGLVIGHITGVVYMCLAQSSGAASRAEGKELERIENERIRQNNNQP